MMKTTRNGGTIHHPSYDLVVIGAGSAGTCGANTAAIFGHRVALVEKEAQIGGAGINSGTVPSKTLRETALALSGWRSRKLFGLDLSLRREATMADFTRHQDNVTAGQRRSIESRLEQNGVDCFRGTARFVDPHTLRITVSSCRSAAGFLFQVPALSD